MYTLRRVVLHHRDVDADEESMYFEGVVDGDFLWDTTLTDLFVDGECESMGIDNPPQFIVGVFKELLVQVAIPTNN